MKKIPVTWRERLKASTPDWGNCPACKKLRAMVREIYSQPTPWQVDPDYFDDRSTSPAGA